MGFMEDAAEKIVREISSTIHQAVNLMNAEGEIIASTDPGRIGVLHEGAKKLINEKLSCLEVYRDEEYQGSKAGINLPVRLRGNIVGVIGISGEWGKIEPYIELIRKTAETLVMNAYLQTKELEAEDAKQRYLHTLLFGNRSDFSEEFTKRGRALGIDVLSCYRCLCISFANDSGALTERLDMLFESVQKLQDKAVCRTSLLVYREMTQITLFLQTENMRQSAEQAVFELEQTLRKQHTLTNGIRLKIGIDDGEHRGFDLRIGRERAEKSLRAAMIGKDTVSYKELTAGIFLNEISDKSKQEYIQKIFSDMTTEEITHWTELLECFYESDGSIQKTSEKLFIHKNTLQYQLKKLASITGYDPRSIKNAGIYQYAIWFWRTIK